MVRKIKDLAEFNKALKEAGEKLVVVDFTASWCPPCQRIAPLFETLSINNQDVVFLKVDVDEAQDVSAHCEIKCMPTFKFYKKEKKVFEFSGGDSKKLEESVASLK